MHMVHDFSTIIHRLSLTLSPMAAAPNLISQPWTTPVSDLDVYGRRNGALSGGYLLFSITERRRRRRRSKGLKIITLSADDPSYSSGRKKKKCGDSISDEKKKRPLWKKIVFSSKKLRSVLLLNVVAVVYASDFSVVKAVETTTDPAAFSTVRFILSAIPFLPLVLRSRGDIGTRNAGLELGLWASLGYLIEALSLLTADAGRASFISLFTVIVVPLVDGMLGANVPARTWFGALMSVLGVAMLESSGSPPNVGDLLSFLSAIFFGIHMLRTEHFSRITEKEDLLTLVGYEVCVVALSSLIWLVIGGFLDGDQELSQSSLLTWPMKWDWVASFPWTSALYSGVFSTGLCLWAEMGAMRNVSATQTAVIYGLEPVWGAGFAWLLLGERWGTAGWIGAALVLGGSLMVQVVGDTTSSESIKKSSNENKPAGLVLISERQKLPRNLTAASVIVRSSKDVTDRLK